MSSFAAVGNERDTRWWLSKKPEHDAWEVFSRIRELDHSRIEDIKKHMRLYGNSEFVGVTPTTFHRKLSGDRLTLNGIKAVVDSAVALVAKNRVQPFFATQDGNASLMKRGKMLEQFVVTQFYLCDVHNLVPRVLTDAAVCGTGALKVLRDRDKIQVERCLPWELFVDPHDALDGNPRSLFQRKYISREVLKALFPGKAKKIESADINRSSTDYSTIGLEFASDQMEVVEAWHLPSSVDSTDGRHVIFLDGLLLLDEPWEKDYFPFVFFHWSRPQLGFWGTGLAEDLKGLQREVNRLLIKVQQAMHLVGVPWVLVPNGSQIMKAQLNNQIGAIVPFTGAPPIVKPNQSVHPEIFQHLDRLWMRMFEVAGLSGDQPFADTTTRSGAAMRVNNALQTRRFSMTVRQYDQAHLQLANLMIDLGKEIDATTEGGYKYVAQMDRYTIDQVSWKDVDMERDSYILKVFPASALPDDPAGRLDVVFDMLQMGLIGPDEAKRMLDWPDMERQISLDRAASDNIDRILEKILDTGRYEAPEPFIDLQLALKKAQAEYNKALVRGGVPEDRLELLRQWMVAVHQLLIAQMQPSVPDSSNFGPGGGGPMAPPAAGPGGAPPTAV